MRRRTFLGDTGGGFVTLTITLNANVWWINVTVNGVTTTYSSSTTVQVPIGATVSWTATAQTGYILSTSSGNFGQMTEDKTIAPTANVITYTLTITKNSGVKSITVTIGTAAAETFTSSSTRQVAYGTKVTWTATANTGFEMDTASGTINSMTSDYNISPEVWYNFIWDGQPTVDLGLPSGTIWQAYNLGTSWPQGYGLYYQWADTKGYSDACSESQSDGNNDKHYFDSSKYKWCNGSSNGMTKYCTNSLYGTVDNKTVLENEDDAAYAASGGQYRMPTSDECGELFNTSYVTRYKAKCNRVKGYALVSKNDTSKAIFFPAAGYGTNSYISSVESEGAYWSTSLNTSRSSHAHDMSFNLTSGNVYPQYYTNPRWFGRNIRGVVS